MNRRSTIIFTLVLTLPPVLAAAERAVHWPGFRGPQASGTIPGTKPPLHWDVPKKQNVKWRTAIPGLGHSCPVIVGHRLFVTTAVNSKAKGELKLGLYGNIAPVKNPPVHSWWVHCLDTRTGKLLWKRTYHEGVPSVLRHTKATHANSTPATDGRHLVTFLGSEGLVCLDLDGKLLWQKNLGPLDAGYFRVPSAQWGFGSSPVIHDGKVIIQCDVQKNAFLAALDVKTGKTLWRTPRADVPTWSTPAIHVTNTRAQVIVNGYRHLGGYDLATGKEIWKLRGGGDIPVPTPILGHGLVYLTNAHGRMSPIYAIRPGATGDITLAPGETANDHIAWSVPRGGGYMQTPIIVGNEFYTCRDSGILTCYDARTGQRHYSERLARGMGFTASPVAADGKIYFASETGEVVVVQAGEKFKVLARNPLGAPAMATPALAGDTLFFRTLHHVVAVGGN